MSRLDTNLMLVTEVLGVFFLIKNLIVECEYCTCNSMNCASFAFVKYCVSLKTVIKWVRTEVKS